MLKWFNKKKKDNKGFTLVELVIVIAILAILTGLLAPQYTKYVEKARKAADAANMDEMVKVVKVYAADPVNELAAGKYTIKISDKLESDVGTTITYGALDSTSSQADSTDTNLEGLKTEMTASIPNWEKTVTKSKKWNAGASSAITAEVTVNAEGGTSVTDMTPDTFKNYMETSGGAKDEEE